MQKKRNVLVTGSSGFIGSNLLIHLNNLKNDFNVNLLKYNSSKKKIDEKTKNIDIIFHLAGVNRAKNLKDFNNNYEFIDKICNSLVKNGSKSIIIFASTFLIDNKNKISSKMHQRYISSKIQAENILKKFNSETGNNIYIYRLPHIMGKWAKPNYNSVIATFCYNIANDKKTNLLNSNNKLFIVQIDDVIKSFLKILNGKIKTDLIYLKNKSITVKKLYDKILEIDKSINENLTIPLYSSFDKHLYSTFISYLPKKKLTQSLKDNKDLRGNFVECFKSNSFGQVSFFTSHPRVNRGGHFHHLKCEIFIVIQGRALFTSKSVKGGKTKKFYLTEKNLKLIRTVPGEIHMIKNIDKKKLIVMLWSNEMFNKDFPDTYFVND